MQNEEDQQSFVNYAKKIGDDLLAQFDGKIKWDNIHDPVNAGNDCNVSLYTGISGVLLYYGKLFAQTKDSKYLAILEDGLTWLKENKEQYQYSNYSFYSGQLGIVYALTQMVRSVPNEQKSAYLKVALEITQEASAHQYHFKEHISDLIGGIAGMIIVLLHLHSCHPAAWIITDIQMLTKALIRRAEPGRNGLFWDRSSKSKSGLCGFAHGASGIAFTFLELGKYFKNEAFFKTAALALAYEDSFYDASVNNWLDLRLKEEDLDLMTKNYQDTRQINVVKEREMSAWCHGAPGIGLTRLRAFELTKEKRYQTKLESALLKTKAFFEYPIGLCLCHGITGNALLFLELYKRLGNDQYWEFSVAIGKRLVKGLPHFGWKGTPENISASPFYSLFLGELGLGYFMLQLANPLSFESVLLPTVNGTFQGPSNYLTEVSILDISNELYQKYYPKTYSQLGGKIKQPMALDYSGHLVENLNQAVQQELTLALVPSISEIFNMEKTRLLWLVQVENIAALEIVEQQEKIRNRKLLTQDINHLTIQLSDAIKLFETTAEWEGTEKSNEEDTLYWVCRLTAKGIVEYRVNWFVFLVLSIAEKAMTSQDIIAEVKQELEEVEVDNLEVLVETQLKEALKEALLLVV